MTRLTLLLATYLFVLLLANPTRACPVFPSAEALVGTGLSSIGRPLEVSFFGDPPDSTCIASLHLTLSALPSRSLVPRPRELAEELAGVAQIYGARTCEISVWVVDDSLPEDERFEDPDVCRRAEFRYDEGSWWAVEDEEPCWSE